MGRKSAGVVSVVGSPPRAGSPHSVAAASAAKGLLAISPAPDSRPEGLLAVSPVAVSDIHRASLSPGSRAEGLLAASLAADPGAEDRLAAPPTAGSRADGLLVALPAAVFDGLLRAVSPSLPPFLSRPVPSRPAPSRPRSCISASADLETCNRRLADVCSLDSL